MSNVMTAKEIARWACSGGAHEPDIETAILRHMEHHMLAATKAEREACVDIIVTGFKAGWDAYNMIDEIKARNKPAG
jgi:hypothetical protein